MLALGSLLPIAASPARSAAETTGIYEHFFGYAQAVVAGDAQRAASFWHPEDLAAAGRLGIVCPDGTPTVDRDSPLWIFVEDVRDSTASYRFGPPYQLATGPFTGLASLMLVVQGTAERSGRRQYLFEPDGRGGWHLVRPERLLAERGPGTPGRFVTVYERRPGAPWELPAGLLADLDATVAAMTARLGMTSRRLGELQEARLGYLLAAPSVVEYVADGRVDGIAVPAAGMVLSHRNHHAPGLARLVVAAWLRTAPLATAAILRDGLVGLLAGEGETPPQDLIASGREAFLTGQVTAEALLVSAWPAAVNTGSPASCASLAGAVAFTGFLLDTFGADAMRDAYLACSGTVRDVHGWTADTVVRRLAVALGVDRDDLMRSFAAWLTARS